MQSRSSVPAAVTVQYVLAQIAEGCAGTWLAHAMFDVPMLQLSATVLSGQRNGFRSSLPRSAC